GLEIIIQDERHETPVTEQFMYEGGIAEFVDYLAVDPPITDTWRVSGSDTFTEKVPVLNEDTGHLDLQEVERECQVDVALRWGTGYETEIRSFVNIISTPKGGTHLAGFEQGLLKVIRKNVEANARKLKAPTKDGAERIETDDVLAGLTAGVTVRLAEPQFEE